MGNSPCLKLKKEVGGKAATGASAERQTAYQRPCAPEMPRSAPSVTRPLRESGIIAPERGAEEQAEADSENHKNPMVGC